MKKEQTDKRNEIMISKELKEFNDCPSRPCVIGVIGADLSMPDPDRGLACLYSWMTHKDES